MTLAFKKAELVQILDPVSWMLLFTEAYSQNAPQHLYVFIEHSLGSLFVMPVSEMLVLVFENGVTTCAG